MEVEHINKVSMINDIYTKNKKPYYTNDDHKSFHYLSFKVKDHYLRHETLWPGSNC